MWAEISKLELGRWAQDLDCQAKGVGLCPEDTEEPGSVLGQRQNGPEVYNSSRVQRKHWRGQAGRRGDINEALQNPRGNLRGHSHGAEPEGAGTGSTPKAELAGCSGSADLPDSGLEDGGEGRGGQWCRMGQVQREW